MLSFWGLQLPFGVVQGVLKKVGINMASLACPWDGFGMKRFWNNWGKM